MKKYIFQTIRAGVILGIALFAFAGEVFAAPTLAPTEAVQITETTATLVGHVENINKTSLVWFKWGDNPSPDSFTTVGMTNIYNKGFFKAYLSGLKPDTVYYYYSASSEGGTTVLSPVISFRTKGAVTATATQTVTYQNTTTANTSATVPVNTQTAQTVSSVAAPVTTQTTPVVSVQAKKKTTPVIAKKTTVAKTATSTQGFVRENNNIAAVIGAGGFFPGTLIGWIALLIALLIVILLFLKIYETSEKRKKAHKVKKPQEGEEEEEVNDIDKILEKNR